MKLLRNQFLSVSAKNAIQIIVRFVVGLLNMKVIALFVGPSGMALFGQLQNTLQIGTTLSGLGFSNGIIRYNSEFRNEPNKQQLYNSSCFTSTLLVSTLLGIIIIIFSKDLSNFLFNTAQYQLICTFGGIYLLSTSFFNFVIAILNGLQKLKRFIILNIIQSVSLLIFISIATALWQTEGMLWALIVQSVFTALASILILVNTSIKVKLHLSMNALGRLSNYSIITLTSGIVGPLALLLIRDIIIRQLSVESAGIWEAISKISNSYIVFVTGAFAYYFLPRFANLTDKASIRHEVHSTYRILIPLLIVGSLSLFLFRTPLINTVFTKEFEAATTIIKWQLIGDVFKVLSWLIGYLLMAKAKTKTFVATEIISGLLQITLTHLLVARFGIEGSTLAYCIENMMYFGMMYLIFYLNWGRTHAS